MQKVTDDFRANNLLEVYLKMNPSKSRSSEETAELDAEYKRGDAVRHPTPLTHVVNTGRSKLALKPMMTMNISVMRTMKD